MRVRSFPSLPKTPSSPTQLCFGNETQKSVGPLGDSFQSRGTQQPPSSEAVLKELEGDLQELALLRDSYQGVQSQSVSPLLMQALSQMKRDGTITKEGVAAFIGGVTQDRKESGTLGTQVSQLIGNVCADLKAHSLGSTEQPNNPFQTLET